MIYRAKYNWFLYNFFQAYSVWKTKMNFHPVLINGSFEEKGLPVLVISNHFSWWDGFWAVYLNYKVFRRRFHFMMLEEQLKKHMFFNKTGGFSIKKGARSILETIEYTAELLTDNKNMVLIFPQGEIRSMHVSEIHFESGTENIIKRAGGNIHLIFLANILDYFSSRKPALFMNFREYSGKDFSTETLRKEYNQFYSDCLSENIKKSDT